MQLAAEAVTLLRQQRRSQAANRLATGSDREEDDITPDICAAYTDDPGRTAIERPLPAGRMRQKG